MSLKKLPPPPYPLTKEERAFYDSVGKAVLDNGKLERGDIYVLALLAHAQAMAVRLRREIAAAKLTTETGRGGMKANPMFRQLETTQGEIRILGKNIYDPDVSLIELRKGVGMVFQRPNPLPISVYENLVFGLRLHHERNELHKADLDAAVESALTEVGLWESLKDKLKASATSLQLEQQQKLCIARLLPLKPEVILMDEPCSALDVDGTRAIEELIFRLRGRYTILIVTHNMAQARRASDECVFMLLGEMIEHCSTEDLFSAPQNPKTAEYIEGRFG